jgi:hypothetical protein
MRAKRLAGRSLAHPGRQALVRLVGVELRAVDFAVRGYPHTSYGYAAAVERAHVVVTPHFDGHTAYAALTRHRTDVHLHYRRDDFATPRNLSRVLSRMRAKDMAVDHTKVGTDANERWRMVGRRSRVPWCTADV